jgi:hypothetical protein
MALVAQAAAVSAVKATLSIVDQVELHQETAQPIAVVEAVEQVTSTLLVLQSVVQVVQE